MEAVIAGFRTTTYPPFPSLSSVVLSCAGAQAQGAAQDLAAAARSLDGPAQVRMYLGLLWDLATFISTQQEYQVATVQGLVEAAWAVIFADHTPIEDTLITVIVCDLFCACETTGTEKREGTQRAKTCFFDLCFGFALDNPRTSKNCGKLLSSLVSLVVSIGGDDGKGARGLLNECARWLRDGSSPLPLFPRKPTPPTEWAYQCISELLQHHVVLSHSNTFAQLNTISFYL